MMNEEFFRFARPVRIAVITVLSVCALFLAVEAIGGIKSWHDRGTNTANIPSISVSGEGEAFAIPDIATFNYSVTEEGKTVKEAQDKATTKTNAALDYLKKSGVDEKDIKTIAYNVNPKYEYQTKVCPVNSYCPGGKQVQTGFEVSQTIEVKVRDTTKAGDILSGIGSLEVQNVSGLQFTTDDETKIQAEAREKAIADAKAKAEVLAHDLGVHLVRISSFQESNSGTPRPLFYDSMAKGAVANESVAPALPTGQNKYTSNVTITYEIR